MDKEEKKFASDVFKVCRSLQRISGGYYQEQIDRATFINLFIDELFNLGKSFKTSLKG